MSSALYIPGETTVPYQCTAGPKEEVIATITCKIFAGLSIFGSSFILSTIYQKWRRNKNSIDPYCRIMLGLSVYDILWSFFPWFLGSWLMPAETGHWGASGNTQTCTMQGFFFWLGVPGAQYYQILLSLHTLLLVTFRWTPLDFHRRIERWSHMGIFLVATILATMPLFFQGYNPECGTCLPAPLPIWCGDWIFWGDGETECIRGSPALSQVYYTIYLTNLSIMGVFCTYSMIQVYCTVRRQEERNSRYVSFRSNSQREKSRHIRRTMILYTFGFYFCWVVPSFIIHFAKQGSPIKIMSYVLLPFQGFFNVIIFLAPKCAKYQKEHPGTWLVTAYLHIFFGSCLRRCRERICGSRPILRWRPDWDDGIGFNDFNEEPNTSAAADATNQEPNTGQTNGDQESEDEGNTPKAWTGDGPSPVRITGKQQIEEEGDNSQEEAVAFCEGKITDKYEKGGRNQ